MRKPRVEFLQSTHDLTYYSIMLKTQHEQKQEKLPFWRIRDSLPNWRQIKRRTKGPRAIYRVHWAQRQAMDKTMWVGMLQRWQVATCWWHVLFFTLIIKGCDCGGECSSRFHVRRSFWIPESNPSAPVQNKALKYICGNRNYAQTKSPGVFVKASSLQPSFSSRPWWRGLSSPEFGVSSIGYQTPFQFEQNFNLN